MYGPHGRRLRGRTLCPSEKTCGRSRGPRLHETMRSASLGPLTRYSIPAALLRFRRSRTASIACASLAHPTEAGGSPAPPPQRKLHAPARCGHDLTGGGEGIRTLEGVTTLPVFKTGAFNRSATPPNSGNDYGISKARQNTVKTGVAPALTFCTCGHCRIELCWVNLKTGPLSPYQCYP